MLDNITEDHITQPASLLIPAKADSKASPQFIVQEDSPSTQEKLVAFIDTSYLSESLFGFSEDFTLDLMNKDQSTLSKTDQIAIAAATPVVALMLYALPKDLLGKIREITSMDKNGAQGFVVFMEIAQILCTKFFQSKRAIGGELVGAGLVSLVLSWVMSQQEKEILAQIKSNQQMLEAINRGEVKGREEIKRSNAKKQRLFTAGAFIHGVFVQGMYSASSVEKDAGFLQMGSLTSDIHKLISLPHLINPYMLPIWLGVGGLYGYLAHLKTDSLFARLHQSELLCDLACVDKEIARLDEEQQTGTDEANTSTDQANASADEVNPSLQDPVDTKSNHQNERKNPLDHLQTERKTLTVKRQQNERKLTRYQTQDLRKRVDTVEAGIQGVKIGSSGVLCYLTILAILGLLSLSAGLAGVLLFITIALIVAIDREEKANKRLEEEKKSMAKLNKHSFFATPRLGNSDDEFANGPIFKGEMENPPEPRGSTPFSRG